MYVDTVLWILFAMIQHSSNFPSQLDLNSSPSASASARLQKVTINYYLRDFNKTLE